MLDAVIGGLHVSPVRLRRYAWALAAFWTAAIAASFGGADMGRNKFKPWISRGARRWGPGRRKSP